MYIAFKWLVALSLTMWLLMCSLDAYIKRHTIINIYNTGIYNSPVENFENETVKLTPVAAKTFSEENIIYLYDTHDNKYNKHGKKYVETTGLQSLFILAGALIVTAFLKNQNKYFTLKRFPRLSLLLCQIEQYFKIAAIISSTAIVKYLSIIWEKVYVIFSQIRSRITGIKTHPTKHNKIHIILLKKLKEMGEERKNLGQLLITAIRENKHIRMRYELETLTKNRLMQHMEEAQKQIKENRSRYLSFQQLYLITHQENNYLKARLVKLKQERNETTKNLMGLINEVYLSSNKELKTYCTRFLVKTKDNLLNSDVCAEIKEFLENSRKPSEITLVPDDIVRDTIRTCSSVVRITELDNEESNSLMTLASDAPKLRGLPGEYVWTVKDKNGIIEKLYEYDFESDLNSGDTIRRIRQYSVYYDKDCLLDFSKVHRATDTGSPNSISSNVSSNSLGYQKMVTSSKAFQNFLKSSTSLVRSKSHRGSSLFYG